MKYIRNQFFLKSISIFFLLLFLQSILLPSISLALTAGPTAPEYSSFEPVDTTDMVNLATGDFTYNIPLIEVPGPEGGYPLSLSYHAGIQPDEEASWVGLGWTLNAGAISRSVNGYPDDASAEVRSVRDYWKGGESNTFSTGVGYAGVNFGLSFSNDTYQGFGVGMNFGVGVQEGAAGYGVEIGTSAGGQAYASAGVNAGVKIGQASNSATSLGVNAGISTNFETIDGYTGIGLYSGQSNNSLLGATIATGNASVSASVGGISINQNNNYAGKISTESNGFSGTIPTPWGIYFSLGYNYVRYWSDELENVSAYGALNFDKNNFTPQHNSNPTLDSYPLFDLDDPNSYSGEPDSEKGGSFPSYDSYSVSGQGIGGAIQPYILENTYLYRHASIDKSKEIYVNHTSFGYSNKRTGKVNFKFKGDFSNSFLITPPPYPSLPTVGNEAILENEKKEFIPEGFNEETNHLAGSKHIEWFTNWEIQQGTAYSKGFITYENNYGDRSLNKYDLNNIENLRDQVGGFMITNESGVSYHYSLPVYNYSEYSRTQNESGDVFRESSNPQPYAYTWLLTGITGPDYVDRGNYGFSSDDFGYWIKFEHGMWTDKYKWRNPAVGWQKDLDQDLKTYSRGIKELYYLDAIITRTHTALFEKEIRHDGKGVSDYTQGGFIPVNGNRLVPLDDLPPSNTQKIFVSGSEFVKEYPVSTLKLNNIYLFENNALNKVLNQSGVNSISQLKSKGSNTANIISFKGSFMDCLTSPDDGTQTCGTPYDISLDVSIPEYFSNVIEYTDINAISAIKDISLKVIEFNSDYTLCKNTPNSFVNNSEIYTNSPLSDPLKDGKLTLKSLYFKGYAGASILPGMEFTYGTGSNNPDYDPNKKDLWGMYKSDYDPNIAVMNENAARYVSDASSGNVDVWCLKQILTTTGATIKISYESDTYDKVALGKQQLLRIQDVQKDVAANSLKVYLFPEILALDYYYKVNDKISIDVLTSYLYKNKTNRSCDCVPNNFDIDLFEGTTAHPLGYTRDMVQIKQINKAENYIVVESKELFTDLTQKIISTIKYPGNDPHCSTCTYTFDNGWPDYITGGIITAPMKTKPGGGLRTKSVSVVSDNVEYATNYKYQGGSTTFEPFGLLSPRINPAYQAADPSKTKKIYKQLIFKRYNNLILNAREIPGPGVIYQTVSVQESVKDATMTKPQFLPGKRDYEFSLFDADSPKSSVSRMSSTSGDIYKTITLKDYCSRVGNLKSVTVYDEQNNIIEKTTNIYLHDQPQVIDNNKFATELTTRFASQGRIEQLFHELRFIGEKYIPIFMYSKKEEYPAVLVRQEKIDKNGVSQNIEHLKFDFYTGAPLKTLSNDSYGNYFISESDPAYQHYGDMGLKIFKPQNAHMLSQNAFSKSYEVASATDFTPTGLVGARAQTWTDQSSILGEYGQTGIWRPYGSFQYMGNPNQLNENGTHNYVDFNNDNFKYYNKGDIIPPTSFWQQTGTITLYDPFSNALEAKDINNNFSATRMNPFSTQVTSLAINSSYNEMGYSGAEYYSTSILNDGGVNIAEGIISSDFAHTGNQSIQLLPGTKGLVFTLKSSAVDITKKYAASVWAYLPGEAEQNISDAKIYYKIGNIEKEGIPKSSYKAGNWYLLNIDIIPGTDDIEIGCKNNSSSRAVYFDDFRIYPKGASFLSYVYDQKIGKLSAILNADNLYNRYEYDAAGKLIKTYQEFFYTAEKKVNSQIYNYSRK